MHWRYLDLDKGLIHVWQLKRRRFRHGCSNPHECATRYHKTGMRQSRPVLPIPPPLIPALRSHKATQATERLAAGDHWKDWDLVFAAPDGGPINPRQDWAEWKSLLQAAGIRDARPHDGRHTAATLLLEQGVDIRVVQGLLGHSSLAVTKRYTGLSLRDASPARPPDGSRKHRCHPVQRCE